MKMILAILPTNLSEKVSQSLLDESFRVTKFASTAGFLSGGITTLMIITPANSVEKALELIRKHIPPSEQEESSQPRVTIYVLDVKDFEKV